MKKFSVLFLVLAMLATLCACTVEDVETMVNETAEIVTEAVEEAVAEEAPVEEAPVEEAPVEEAPVEEAPVEEPKEEISLGKRNALSSAKSYLSFMAFSYSGLVEQLEFEGYSNEEAVYAADNCGADWNEQAAKSAESYLDLMAFSREGLIEQLVFEGYTQAQAEYGAAAVGY